MHKFIPWALGAGVLAIAIGANPGQYLPPQQSVSSSTQHQSSIALAQADLLQEEPQTEGMTVERIQAILEAEAENVQGQQGQFEFVYEGRTMLILTHQPLNRMRIVTPVTSAADLTEDQRQNLLIANFHRALDSRYAISNGVVFSVFIHPLSTLDDADFRSALKQVAALAKNFGTTYSSDALQFGGQAQPDGPVEGLPGA